MGSGVRRIYTVHTTTLKVERLFSLDPPLKIFFFFKNLFLPLPRSSRPVAPLVTRIHNLRIESEGSEQLPVVPSAQEYTVQRNN